MRLNIAATLFARLKGLAGRSVPSEEIILASCRDIHTYTMHRKIDVAFVSPKGEVLAVYRELQPHKRKKCKNAAFVIERIAQDGCWLQVGDELGLTRISLEAIGKERR